MAFELEGSSAELDGPALSSGAASPPRAARPYDAASPDTLSSPHMLPPGFEAAPGSALLQQPQQPVGEQPVEPLLRSRPPSLSNMVPLAEVAGGSTAAEGSTGLPPGTQLQLQSDDEHNDSSCGMDSEGVRCEEELEAGYESSDDMDCMSSRHCINCTGDMWGVVCRACGYMDGHEASIFDPVVAPPPRAALLRGGGTPSTVISFDERMLLHDEDLLPLHPERADRIRAVMARLDAAQLTGQCRRLQSREATPQEVERCHVPELMTAINLLSERSRLHNETLHWPTSDTYVNQHTALCARLSAGACVDVAVAVARGEAANGVAIVRPPGHHAESNTAMGFCFFNNAGIAARAAQAAGARRVVILDWDVHHGNGTQHIFEGDASVMYMSLHRYDGGQFYPGTGAVSEVGSPGAEGSTVNVPWPCGGMRNGDYMAAFQHLLLPIAYEFAPDLVIISAGFDAAEGDPIGGCLLTPEVYAHMTAMLQNVAPTVLLLEGGYNLMSVAKSTEACVRVLLGERPPPLPPHQHACEAGMSTVAAAIRVQSRYWRSVRGLLAGLLPPTPAAALAAVQRASTSLRSPTEGEAGQEDEEEEDLADEADTDTPHVPHTRVTQPFPSGSGWDSDVELNSGGSLGGSLDDSAREQAQGEQLAREPTSSVLPMRHVPSTAAVDSQGGGASGGEGGGDDAELHVLQHAGSGHLLPLHDCGGGPGAQHEQQHSPQDATGPVGGPGAAAVLGSGSGWNRGAAMPAAVAAITAGREDDDEGKGQEDAVASANWRRLALKVHVIMKRTSQKRLSPQLVREASRDVSGEQSP